MTEAWGGALSVVQGQGRIQDLDLGEAGRVTKAQEQLTTVIV